jgi:mono/diheme cytochrome c family protein
MKNCVYILFSKKLNRFYIGQTSHLDQPIDFLNLAERTSFFGKTDEQFPNNIPRSAKLMIQNMNTSSLKNSFFILFFSLLVIACGTDSKPETKKQKFQKRDQSTPRKQTNQAEKEAIPIDMNNKGIGPISSLTFEALNQEMADQGKKIFKQKCVACHKENKRFMGPAMKGVYERRSPEWVMNMMLNPTEMLKKDPIAIALLKEYNNTIMINQNLTEEEARALAEYFRTL